MLLLKTNLAKNEAAKNLFTEKIAFKITFAKNDAAKNWFF